MKLGLYELEGKIYRIDKLIEEGCNSVTFVFESDYCLEEIHTCKCDDVPNYLKILTKQMIYIGAE